MAGMLSAGGGYRRTVLAVAVTGTVCAGVGLVVYAGLKKLQGKKSVSGRSAEPEANSGKGPSTDNKEPTKSPEPTKEVPEKAEKPKVEAGPTPSVKETTPAQAKAPTEPEKPSKPLAESKPAPPSQPPASSQPAASPPKVPVQPQPPKPAASEKVATPQPKLEAPVAEKAKEEKSEAVKVSTVTDPFQIAKVESVAAADVKVKEVAKVPLKEEVPASVDKVVENAKGAVRETLDSATTKASGDGPDSLSLSSIDSKLDSDIVVIDDIKAASGDSAAAMGHVREGAGDVMGTPVAPVVGVPLSEMLTPPEMPSMGALSSLGDDIEIIQDSPPSTDTTDSGDFVKCDRNIDLSQSIEILKAPKSEDKSEEEQRSQQPSAKEETKQTGPVSTGSVGDDNANFQPPSSKADGKAQPPVEENPQENK